MSEAECRHLQNMKKTKDTSALATVAGVIALLAMAAAFVVICCAASGYHWE